MGGVDRTKLFNLKILKEDVCDKYLQTSIFHSHHVYIMYEASTRRGGSPTSRNGEAIDHVVVKTSRMIIYNNRRIPLAVSAGVTIVTTCLCQYSHSLKP